MSNFGDHPAGFFGVSGFYNGVATQSARFDYSSSPTLYKTPSASSLTTWTWSGWFKLASTANTQFNIFSADSATTNYQLAALNPNTHGALSWVNRPAGGQNQQLITNQLFRDTSAWYHLVLIWDTTNSTAGDRSRMYLNGSRITSFATETQPNQNTESIVNTNIRHNVGSAYAVHSNNVNGFNGYLAEINFVDGLALDSSYFGETKNGVWIAKTPVVSNYGQNGYRLQMKQVGVGTAGTGTIGADTSGKGNHYTSGGIVASDCAMPDSPENNFATWNPLKVGGGAKGTMNGGASNRTFAEGNLSVSLPANTWAYASQICPSGKWYAEICVKTIGSTNGEISWGWHQYDEYSDVGAHGGYNHNWQAYYHAYSTDHIKIYDDGSQLGSNINLTISAGDILQLAWDIDNRKGWIGLNNTWYAADNGTDGNPSAGTNQTFDFTEEEAKGLAVMVANGTSTDVHILNTGQDSSFAGTKTAQGNKDVNGIGDFFYAVPTDFQALCTKNLEEPTIGPNSGIDEQAANYFDVFKYTGNGSDNHDVPDQTAATSVSNQGLGFKPDMVFTLRNDGGFHKFLTDSTRGGDKNFFVTSNSTHNVDSNAIKAFNAPTDSNPATNGGYRLGTSTNFNVNTKDYFSPCWKVNGSTTSTNEDGSIDSTVQVNTTAGISIVQATSPASGTWSVGHGLGVKPKWIILKYIASGSRFTVFFDGFTSGQYLELNGTGGVASSGTPFNFTVTDTLIGGNANYDSTSVVGMYYCFAEIDGFSKIGTFTGNESTDGTYVYTGFRPQMIIAKSQGSGNWHTVSPVFDHEPTNENAPINPLGYFNLSDTASSTGNYQNYAHYDFLSNGFKIRDNGSESNAAGKFNYYAVATAPFKYSNAT